MKTKNTFGSYDMDALKEAPIPEIAEIARSVAEEGMVLLKNEKNTLPFIAGDRIAVFGRGQREYCKSGTGSGGMVNVTYLTNILEELLKHEDLIVNQKLLAVYDAWLKEHPFDHGSGWAGEPWCQEEMIPSEECVKKASKESSKALIILVRTAGEDQDNSKKEGSWYLTENERALLALVSKYFKNIALVLNVGNIVDMNFVEEYHIDAVLYGWQGGMEGGRATANLLTGVTTPSGKLTDTIARTIEDYPSDKNFGDAAKNVYEEDIYVGYRYFETFKPDAVLYPFGYGISYTTFDVKTKKIVIRKRKGAHEINVFVNVQNTGAFPGKEVVQVYLSKPQGLLGQPVKELVAYIKTDLLEPGASQKLELGFYLEEFASYDDSGVTGYPYAYVLEAGQYLVCVGTDVRSAEPQKAFVLDFELVEQCRQCLAPVEPFKRLKPDGEMKESYEDTPLRTYQIYERIKEEQPRELSYTGDVGIKLQDVLESKASMDAFVAQLSDQDLIHLSRGEGMNSPKVTPGTGSCFGGVTEGLQKLGIPIACTTDGPSGIRMDVGLKATSLPNGTLIACTWNIPLIYILFLWEGVELCAYKIDALLGPGINLHRHPLNGRNFEYFSEDPYLTGCTASAMCAGLSKQGVTCTIKHFACNNQEWHRHEEDSVVSERALRELYLRSFEIAVKDGAVQAIMTSYNLINGLHGASCYDLTTSILRKEWGYQGFVMTDWWAKCNREDVPESRDFIAPMIQAQNDVYMVCADALTRQDRAEEGLKLGYFTRADLQRNAKNILKFLMHTHAMKRFIQQGSTYLPQEKPDLAVLKLQNTLQFDEENRAEATFSYSGKHAMKLFYSCDSDELAQVPFSLLFNGSKVCFDVVHGTKGEEASLVLFGTIEDTLKGTFSVLTSNRFFHLLKIEFYK